MRACKRGEENRRGEREKEKKRTRRRGTGEREKDKGIRGEEERKQHLVIAMCHCVVISAFCPDRSQISR
jgi:hypothetical protein